MAAAPATAGDGSLPARAAPGAGCNALGSAAPHSRGCCRPAGRDTSRTPAPARWRGPGTCPAPGTPGSNPCRAQPRRSPGGGDAPGDPAEGQMGHPPPSPPGSRAQPLPREVPGPTWHPHEPHASLGTAAGAGFALQTPAPIPAACCRLPAPPSRHCPGAHSSAGQGPSPALGGSTPSSLERGRAHAPQGCPRRHQAARPGPGGVAVSSQGLRVSKRGWIKHPGLAQINAVTALKGFCVLLL